MWRHPYPVYGTGQVAGDAGFVPRASEVASETITDSDENKTENVPV